MTIADSRSSSRRPASISSWASASAVEARASSSRSRSPLSGVRSWCEASATNSRWLATQPLEPRGHVVERAREPLLLGAALDAWRGPTGRPRRRGAPPGRAARTGPATWPAISAPAPRPSTSTSSPIAISPSVARRVARLTASTLWVTRTAPDRRRRCRRRGSGTAVARIVCVERLAAALLLARGRRSSAAAISGRRAVVDAEPLLAGRVGDQPAAGPDDDHAAAHLLGGALGHLLEPLAVRSSSSTRHRDELGLAAAPATRPRRRPGRGC